MSSNQLPAKIIIIGVGNPARGDDALGPKLLHLIEQRRSGWNVVHRVDLITDYQLQIEHASDLENCDMALFVDASMKAPPPYWFDQLQPERDTSYTSHALSPAAVLQVFEDANQRSAPNAFLLSIRGESFELGDPLSKLACTNLIAACQFTQYLLENPNLSNVSG